VQARIDVGNPAERKGKKKIARRKVAQRTVGEVVAALQQELASFGWSFDERGCLCSHSLNRSRIGQVRQSIHSLSSVRTERQLSHRRELTAHYCTTAPVPDSQADLVTPDVTPPAKESPAP
jgi:hypothetical protein